MTCSTLVESKAPTNTLRPPLLHHSAKPHQTTDDDLQLTLVVPHIPRLPSPHQHEESSVEQVPSESSLHTEAFNKFNAHGHKKQLSLGFSAALDSGSVIVTNKAFVVESESSNQSHSLPSYHHDDASTMASALKEKPEHSTKPLTVDNVNMFVLELFENGHHETRDMNRAELHQYIKTGVTKVNTHGQHAPSQFASLTARDIRKLDDSFEIVSEPVIFVRQHVVLINIDPLRAIVLRDRCLLLLPYGADDILSVVMDKMLDHHHHPHQQQQHEYAFEFRAIETILESIVRVLDREFFHLKRLVDESLKQLRKVVFLFL